MGQKYIIFTVFRRAHRDVQVLRDPVKSAANSLGYVSQPEVFRELTRLCSVVRKGFSRWGLSGFSFIVTVLMFKLT
jgi:hypothetical protein